MLTPKEIVDALDRHIVGQDSAKRAVAIALRNRYRRSRLSAELREDITPKNIIMVGPTGVGKTEIARRLAKLVDAPLVKVEATKFTEVGYVGRDVDSMIRDLVEASIRLCKQRKQAEVRILAETSAEQRLIDLLTHSKSERRAPVKNPLQMLLSAGTNEPESAPGDQGEEQAKAHSKREAVADELRAGLREEDIVEIEVDQALPQNDAMYAILPADYPTDGRETFPITEFEGRDFLMPYGRFDIDVGAAFRKYGVKPVIRPCHVDDETVIRMVGKGLGISMMAEMMIRGKLSGVKTLPVSPAVSRELGMGLRPGGHLPEGIARLRECVLEFIGEL